MDWHELITGQSFVKQAAGKMMQVACSGLEQDGKVGIRTRRLCVWMPDCKKHRDIIGGDDTKAKAALIYKYWIERNRHADVHFCDVKDAWVVE